jgi:ubiquinone/menaquinone biosynthesis C-methylase UbiE
MIEKILNTILFPVFLIQTKINGTGETPPIQVEGVFKNTPVDTYWNHHTVSASIIRSVSQSEKKIKSRFDDHPLFRELSGFYGSHDNEVILDYGCGPGNDLVGFALHTRAKKIIGIDISRRSLTLASHRIALHKMEISKFDLIQIQDSDPVIPVPDKTVDYLSCQGVLQHTSNPEFIISEFFRVLKNGSHACIMVYNKNSIWYHLYTAYQKMIIEKKFSGLSLTDAFSKNTDGKSCPISRCYMPDDFIRLCESAGFTCQFRGGYFTHTELNCLKKFYGQSKNDNRLGPEQREYLNSLTFDINGYPLYKGYYAGVSGVFHLTKREL